MLNFKVTRAKKTTKKHHFDPNWVFLDCNSSLNSQTATKWCINIEGPYSFWWSSVIFQGHTAGRKMANLALIWVKFLDDNFFWIHGWLTNDTDSLVRNLEKVILLSYKFICQISRSQSGQKISDFMDLDLILARSLSWSQLSNLPDLPCSRIKGIPQINFGAPLLGYP